MTKHADTENRRDKKGRPRQQGERYQVVAHQQAGQTTNSY